MRIVDLIQFFVNMSKTIVKQPFLRQNKIIKAQISITEAGLLKSKSKNMLKNQQRKSPAKTTSIKNMTSKSPNQNKSSNSLYNNKKSLKDELTYYLETVTNSKQNLCSCLQLCKLIETSHQQQRCLEHNNTLTLYCITQRKLICVNCIYGVHKHRTHRILPIKDNIEFVVQDNKNLKTKLEKELKVLDDHIQSARKNTLLLQEGLKKSLIDIEAEFRIARENLEKSFDREKINALKRYQVLIEVSQEVSARLEQLKYTIWQSISKYNFNRPKIDEEEQLAKQLIFNNVLQSIDVNCRQITKEQLQKIYEKKNLLTILPEQTGPETVKNTPRNYTSVLKGKKV